MDCWHSIRDQQRSHGFHTLQHADLISHSPAFGPEPNNQFNQNLPELVLNEEIQQVAMKRDESLSPSLFTFRSHFAAMHHH